MSVHLHVRSTYTLLNSTLQVDAIVAEAQRNQCQAIALCDRNVMHAAMSFYHACIKASIKPIFAIEFICQVDTYKIGLHAYAKDDIGFKKLLALSTRLNTDGEILSLETLKTYDQQLIITTSGIHDDLRGITLPNHSEQVKTILTMCKDTLDEFYIAIAMNDSNYLKRENDSLKRIANLLSIKTFALSRIYYANQEGEMAYKVLCAIDQQKSLFDESLRSESGRYFRSQEEMKHLYESDDLQMSESIASRCNVRMDVEKASLPIFKNTYGVDSPTFLMNLCRKGLRKRLNNQIVKAYADRLDYELQIICEMGYADYFLIVYDVIRFARSRGIYVGPGRGSAAGSLISYCLGITHVDPIQYGLLFERFLNPQRISMPDIDIDFPDNRRDEVITYVKETYGDEHVAHIVTFNTLAAKQVLRDVGRALQVPISDVDILTKFIPNIPKVSLQATYEANAKFRQMIQSSKKLSQVYAIAIQLEGLPRHTSTHAAGIVLSDKKIVEVCPLITVEEHINSTQYTMEYLEALGLIKIDFLGLRNLTIIDDVVSHIKKSNENIQIMQIPMDDLKTIQLLQDVDTVGIFQLESEGMKSLLKQMRIRNFEEIVAAIALFRPGPMENIPIYLQNREHPDKIDYLHPTLKPIIENTYGVMIYQEQIMQVTQVMANFSLGKADILRRAISKKQAQELERLQQDFIKGAVDNGYEEAFAVHIYSLILKFAGYGFNRSHSVAYALIAYQLAYLKANYPLSFFASLLNSVIASESKSSEYIFEARKRGIVILRGDVNYSSYEYVIEGNDLRFPLIAIKGVGSAICQVIMEQRKIEPYHDFFDFVSRVSLHKVTSKVIENLIDAGALDQFATSRASMRASIDDALRYASLIKVTDQEQSFLNFDIVSKPQLHQISDQAYEKSMREKQVLGFYLSEHPITKLRMQFNQHVLLLAQLHKIKGKVACLGVIERCKQHRTKNGELMAFVVISDETSKYDLAIMPKLYKNKQEILIRGNYIYVEGVIGDRDSCLVHHLEMIQDIFTSN